MNLRRLLTTPARALRMARLFGPLYLFEYARRTLRWKWDTWLVRRSYFLGQRRWPASRLADAEHDVSRELADYGLAKIDTLKQRYAGKYTGRADLRFLFRLSQEGGTQYFFFHDLAQCLTHVGVSVRLYRPGEPLDRILAEFKPTVFLAVDNVLETEESRAEVRLLADWRAREGLARLYLPYYRTPILVREASPSESARIAGHQSGQLADAFLGYFEEVFWRELCRPWHATGLEYFPITFAANPFRHFPIPVAHDLDWGIVTTNSDMGERAALTRRFMDRIMREYRGMIVGYQWGPGISPIPHAEVAQFCSRIKVSPNPAASSNVRYPIDCGAKVHELLAMGIFQLVSEIPAIRKYYSPDEIVSFTTPEEFDQRFDQWVGKPGERMALVKRGMDRVFAENTYFQRIDKIVGILDKHPEWFGRK